MINYRFTSTRLNTKVKKGTTSRIQHLVSYNINEVKILTVHHFATVIQFYSFCGDNNSIQNPHLFQVVLHCRMAYLFDDELQLTAFLEDVGE